jgi:energy-coupling factor transport system substrate-specific component
MDNVRRDFGTLTWVLIPVAVAINVAIGQLILLLKLPLYLDSIGTVLVGVLSGGLAGALTGFVSNVVWGFLGNVIYVPFAAVAAGIGLLAGFFADVGWFKSWWKTAIGGLVTGMVAAILSAPIAAFVFGGVTGSGTDAVVALFRGLGLDVLGANMAQGVTSDPIDKAISFLVVWLILRALPMRFLARFPRSGNVDRG